MFGIAEGRGIRKAAGTESGMELKQRSEAASTWRRCLTFRICNEYTFEYYQRCKIVLEIAFALIAEVAVSAIQLLATRKDVSMKVQTMGSHSAIPTASPEVGFSHAYCLSWWARLFIDACLADLSYMFCSLNPFQQHFSTMGQRWSSSASEPVFGCVNSLKFEGAVVVQPAAGTALYDKVECTRSKGGCVDVVVPYLWRTHLRRPPSR